MKSSRVFRQIANYDPYSIELEVGTRYKIEVNCMPDIDGVVIDSMSITKIDEPIVGGVKLD